MHGERRPDRLFRWHSIRAHRVRLPSSDFEDIQVKVIKGRLSLTGGEPHKLEGLSDQCQTEWNPFMTCTFHHKKKSKRDLQVRRRIFARIVLINKHTEVR